jgi:hypothetical protein
LFLFRNAGQGIYWAPRSAAEFVATSNQPYTPPADGWYGVVVVKDDDGTGSFSLRVTNALLGADNGPLPVTDGLRAVTPNPTTGPMRVDFDLAAAGAPEFELLDLQGRRVSRVMAGDHGPGRWSVAIGNSDERGQSLAAGVYLVRMKLGERTVASRRVVIER